MKRRTIALLLAGMMLLLSGCGSGENTGVDAGAAQTSGSAEDTAQTEGGQQDGDQGGSSDVQEPSGTVTEGTEEYRGFTLDNVLHSENNGDIHYNLYVPDSYDGSEPYALFFTLPGYQGLYFQGVGENLYTEDFGFTAQEYNPEMIIVAPQLSDWGETSADQTIALVEYFLTNYNIDPVAAYLQCSSQWDGDYAPVVESRTPVYLVIGESDEYYGSEPSREAYENLYELYRQDGLSDEEIDDLLVLDVKDADYFESQGVTVQHGGGGLFAEDEEIMGWLFSK